jgi:hypothetical protein
VTEYTGPTSGRITIGADGDVTKVHFTDKPLSKDEADAVRWFTVMSPNAQLREVRIMKWNLSVASRDRDNWKATAQRLEAELAKVKAELATHAPDGFTLPRAAADLLEHAAAYGWLTGRSWDIAEDGIDGSVSVALGHPDRTREYRLRWAVQAGGRGAGSLSGSGLARLPRQGWRDAPSLKKIKDDMKAHPTSGS